MKSSTMDIMRQDALQNLYSGTLMPWDKQILEDMPLPADMVDPFASEDVKPLSVMNLTYVSLTGWIADAKKEKYYSERFVELSKLVMKGVTTMGRGLVTLHKRGEDLSAAPMQIDDLISVGSYHFRKSYLGVVQFSRKHPEIGERLLINQLSWADMLMRLYRTKEKLESGAGTGGRIQGSGASGESGSRIEEQGSSEKIELPVGSGQVRGAGSEVSALPGLDEGASSGVKGLSGLDAIFAPAAFSAQRALTPLGNQKSIQNQKSEIGNQKSIENQKSEIRNQKSIENQKSGKIEEGQLTGENETKQKEKIQIKEEAEIKENLQDEENKAEIKENLQNEENDTEVKKEIQDEENNAEVEDEIQSEVVPIQYEAHGPVTCCSAGSTADWPPSCAASDAEQLREVNDQKPEDDVSSEDNQTETDSETESDLPAELSGEYPHEYNIRDSSIKEQPPEEELSSAGHPPEEQPPGIDLPPYLQILQNVYARSGPSDDGRLTFTFDELAYLAADPDFNRIYPDQAAQMRSILQNIR